MMQTNIPEDRKELTALCWKVRELMEQGKYPESELLIKDAMVKYLHAPEPHNLLGLLLEAQDDHLTAMKHFRAAYALDPAYLPSRHNLERFGSFYPKGKWAYDETDCPQEKKENKYKTEYDINGIGHIVSAYKIEYDANGIGHAVRGDL